MPLRIPENAKKVCMGRNLVKDALLKKRSGKATLAEATKPIQAAAIKHPQESTNSLAVNKFTTLSVVLIGNIGFLPWIMPEEF